MEALVHISPYIRCAMRCIQPQRLIWYREINIFKGNKITYLVYSYERFHKTVASEQFMFMPFCTSPITLYIMRFWHDTYDLPVPYSFCSQDTAMHRTFGESLHTRLHTHCAGERISPRQLLDEIALAIST